MQVRCLQTTGQGHFEEVMFDKPEPKEIEIEVRALMTGVCRSDIDMMLGGFGPLPLEMQGHEGLGVVTKIGINQIDVKVGDIVATRGEPAYADYYNVKNKEYVKVPSAEPKYILEPVACGINLIYQQLELLQTKKSPKVLILGSGFLAWVAYNTIIGQPIVAQDVTVVGNSNKDLWGDKLVQTYTGDYDIVIDLSSGTDVFDQPIVRNEAIVIFGAQKQVSTDFSNLLWKACTMVFPSPRTDKFHTCMQIAESMITNGQLNVDKFWTQAYNRNIGWQQAFADGKDRPNGYSRGYIVWD
jgi:D-arabinose 1-dehydrogenase-like Zn-dependent alcohol dehydrogenase